jgi:hypothetical protein
MALAMKEKATIPTKALHILSKLKISPAKKTGIKRNRFFIHCFGRINKI